MESKPSTPIRLQRHLTSSEAWGFSIVGFLTWLTLAPTVHQGLGTAAMWVWIPGVIVGILLNLQMREIGWSWQDVSGGTPNYTARLLQRYPALAHYVSIAYYLGWVSFPPINAIVLTDLVQYHLAPLGLNIPEKILEISFTAIAYFVAFSGIRSLAILHLFFVLPALGFLFLFCLQGVGWLAVSPNSPGLLPPTFSGISLPDWLKWYFYAAYSFYACETATSFVADSKKPAQTLNFLSWVSWLMPFVFIGGGWVFMRLATAPGLGSDLYSNLSAATPFWGRHSSFIVTLLITSGCLLGTATTVCNTPRILYQLSIDGYLAPVFSVVSRRGALEPALILTFISSALFLFWGDVNRIVVVSGVCWFVSIMAAHWALWLHRHEPDVRWGRCALGFFLIEGVVLIVGGSAWGWVDLLIGLALPIAVLALDAVIRRVPFAPFHPHWWDQIHSKPTHHRQEQDFLVLQVGVLILLVCAATAVSWLVRSWVDPLDNEVNSHLLVILIMFLAFVAVAIACWTSLPQVSAIDELAATSILQAKQLEQTLSDLKTAQMQMVQTEKMSSLGQLVAGVAHEINNPVNFIHGNLTHLQEYAQDLVRMLRLYQERHPTSDTEVQNLADEIDLEFLMEDLQKMIASMSMGTDRICNIVLSLRNFSRMDEAEFKAVDIHEGIESTLLILQHRIKARSERPAIEIIRDYSQLPLVECYPGQLNQVLMNILVNAIDALDEVNTKRSYKDIEANPSCITIRTAIHQAHWVAITIADNGPGIPDTVRDRIFDPFFTTKPVGKGTGMGMAISYQIITEKHGGMLQCFSTLGKGTEFVLQIPMRQANPPIH